MVIKLYVFQLILPISPFIFELDDNQSHMLGSFDMWANLEEK